MGEIQAVYDRVLAARSLEEVEAAAVQLYVAVSATMASAARFTDPSLDEEASLEVAEDRADDVVTAILLEEVRSSPDAYAWRAGVYAAQSRRRHAKVARRAERRIAYELPRPATPEEELLEAETRGGEAALQSRVAGLLEAAPPNYRWALEQYYLENRSATELAAMVRDRIEGRTLAQAEATVHAWLSRGRRWLRARLEEDG